jgi:hypothetical protein
MRMPGRVLVATLAALALSAGCGAPAPEPASGANDAPAARAATAPDGVAGDAAPPTPSAGETAITPADDAACDWTRAALPVHRAQVETSAAALLGDFEPDGADGERLAALLQRPAQALGDIRGAWRVRSLQVAAHDVYAYPFFQARIDGHACGHRFAKTTGSQRRSGVLYPVDGHPDRLAFLGAATLNDAPPRDYDPARPDSDQHPGDGNSAGWLVRIGPDELLMVLDAVPGGFEVYHLRR